MRRILLIFSFLALALTAKAHSAMPQGEGSVLAMPGSAVPATTDSAVFSALEPKLKEYLRAMDNLTEEAACEEVDFLISSVQDAEVRNRVAAAAYKHFRDSKIMGSESVAIHIYDQWFASFKTVFPTIEELDDAEFHAFVNRQSLIGKPARELVLKDVNAREHCLPAKGRKSIIFFYSASCPKCLFTAHQLRDFLCAGQKADKWVRRQKIDVYNIYTGDDDAEWQEYIESNLRFAKRCKLRIYNLKGGESDFVVAYGVIQTPRLFLVDKNGIIIGRNLDLPALKILLSS